MLTATYRLQLHAGFTFADAAAQVPYLADLGVSHLFCSPILASVPGSMHGYDVLDHTRVDDELGGEDGFRALVAAAHEHDLGIVVDVVPNHMALVAPEHLNAPLWQVLREGRDAPTADWFDIDWKAGGGRLGLPVLGRPLPEVLAAGEITRDDLAGEPVLRYYEHVWPLAPGTADGDLPQVLARQHYTLASWREKDRVLNYRRFFEVDGLIAVRVEAEHVFTATHALLLDLHREGLIDGLRIDHPDGLADPAGYLTRLRRALRPGTPVWVEKILERDERLAGDWDCAGTTGYDALRVVQAALTDPASTEVLDRTWAATGGEPDFAAVVDDAKRQVVGTSLVPEVERLTRRAHEALPGLEPARLREALVELLVAADVYRAYVRPRTPVAPAARAHLADAFARARTARPDLAEELDALLPLALLADEDPAALDLGVRLQQTWGPVMAKGVEDTSFYRWHRLTALQEVGSDPTLVADASPQVLHDWAATTAARWPGTLTTLSTHDTKRSEDVRARLLALAGEPQTWEQLSALAREQAQAAGVDLPTGHLVWQTLAGAWPIDDDRLAEYLVKAVREAKQHTAWVDGDPAYEERVVALATTPGPLHEAIPGTLARLDDDIRAVTLAAKALQLALPGVADVYQGCESVDRSLVDPDNRRAVDFPARRALLDRPDDTLEAAKLRLTSTLLQLRQRLPETFGPGSGYAPLAAGSEHALGLLRTPPRGLLRRSDCAPVAVLVTRAPGRLRRSGGWGQARVELPTGTWRELLTGGEVTSTGEVPVSELLTPRSPVAVLERVG